MGKLCCIDIHYNNQDHRALVDIQHEENNLKCTIRFVERKLGYILPGDVLVYNHLEGLKPPAHMPAALREELRRCICASAPGYGMQ